MLSRHPYPQRRRTVSLPPAGRLLNDDILNDDLGTIVGETLETRRFLNHEDSLTLVRVKPSASLTETTNYWTRIKPFFGKYRVRIFPGSILVTMKKTDYNEMVEDMLGSEADHDLMQYIEAFDELSLDDIPKYLESIQYGEHQMPDNEGLTPNPAIVNEMSDSIIESHKKSSRRPSKRAWEHVETTARLSPRAQHKLNKAVAK